MPTHDIYLDDGVTLTKEECERRNSEIEDVFHRLNASSLLTMIFENFGHISFKRDEVTHINNYEIPPNNTSVNPYDEDFFDYIKDLGGHVLVKYDPQSDDVVLSLATREQGIESQVNGESVGFFSIRRPWNVHSIKQIQEEKK
jgi:hypothetical protein